MITLIISLVAGVVVAVLTRLTLVESFWGMLLPFLVVTIITFVVIARRINRQIEAIMKRFQEEMQSAAQLTKAKVREQAMERSVEILKEALPYGRWMFTVEGMINAQIGQLYYVQQKFKQARPYLEKASDRVWVSRAMLACHLYKKKEHDEMKKIFEKLSTVGEAKKDALFWNLYAWCLWKIKDRDGAMAVLSRGLEVKELEENERIKSNLNALRNGKPVKMRGWKEMWYQFHLEPPPQPKMRFDRRGIRGR